MQELLPLADRSPLSQPSAEPVQHIAQTFTELVQQPREELAAIVQVIVGQLPDTDGEHYPVSL